MSERRKEKHFWQRHFNFDGDRARIPAHTGRISLRLCGLTDEDLRFLALRIRSVNQLDLDENDFGNEGVARLAGMTIRELRLKGNAVNNGCVDGLLAIRGLELLHLGNTAVTLEGLAGKIGALHSLKRLLVSANDSELSFAEQVFLELPAGCALSVNYRPFPFG